MDYPDLHPGFACASTLVSALVRFFDGSFQPHLDQMEHRSVDNAVSYRL